MLWQPLLETDKQGRAQLNFKLADNITSWKMAVIGSTEDGQIGIVEKEIKAFQPFFVEHDPPRVLTEGDEILLPVVVRNYLDRTQSVDLEIKPESWFTLVGPARKRAQVAAGDASRETFDFRAILSVKEGKQRITARAADDSDAIEKPVTVHPDDEELSTTASDIVGGNASLELNIDAATIPNSVQGELKIYPNLMAHVTEGVEAIMQRPYGCGEQTISSTYPSLLLLRYYKEAEPVSKPMGTDGTSAVPVSPLRVRAMRYLQAGYERLLNYRDASGGFTYWGRGAPDLALTAYALRFLRDARGFIAVDDQVVEDARTWLVKQQRNDGSWPARYYWSDVEDKRHTAVLTAYVARVLATTEKAGEAEGRRRIGRSQESSDGWLALGRALDYLAARVEEIDEPYVLASYVLAALDAKEPARASKSIDKLRSLAHAEGNTTYWSLETNTPFYGWGLAGRVETTALVVQALAAWPQHQMGTSASSTQSPAAQTMAALSAKDLTPTPAVDGPTVTVHPAKPKPANQTSEASAVSSPKNTGRMPVPPDALVRSGLLFLLKQKDRYGVWYSTQATINVLDAMLVLLQEYDGGIRDSHQTANLVVNGRTVETITLPSPDQRANLITINIAKFLRPGTNRVEIQCANGSVLASAQAVATYYVPWSAAATQTTRLRPAESTGMRLVAKFDKTESKVSEQISCHVEAERLGFRGYGMMLAEIGLPPGADVDRASLENAMKSSGWAISQYDVLPDRVVVYLWPQGGGVKFDFKFRPRFGLNAKTAPSLIYDYYNPEARAVVVPTKFAVK